MKLQQLPSTQTNILDPGLETLRFDLTPWRIQLVADMVL